MLEFINAVANALISSLFGGGGGGITDTTMRDAMLDVWKVFRALVQWMETLFGHERGAWQFAHPQIVGAAWGLGETSWVNTRTWARLLTIILPNSLSWLDGHTHQWVDAKYDPHLRAIDSELAFLEGWRGQIDYWKNEFVNPSLSTLNSFYRWFEGWPNFDINVLHQWLQADETFANWAVPRIARPLYDYLAQSAHTTLRDQLTTILVDSTPDVFRHVEAAAVAILLTEQ